MPIGQVNVKLSEELYNKSLAYIEYERAKSGFTLTVQDLIRAALESWLLNRAVNNTNQASLRTDSVLMGEGELR